MLITTLYRIERSRLPSSLNSFIVAIIYSRFAKVFQQTKALDSDGNASNHIVEQCIVFEFELIIMGLPYQSATEQADALEKIKSCLAVIK
jgi:hypothetical protein